ncbi:hypothetical protein [Clostridium tyrobutyricum]|uniref:hypothetical protein n=1 Tax=Clostridium tyrobutyricum TaxID=1519 RepID=UPI0030D0CCCB
MINGDKNESWSNGKIDIIDDVWIGMNCIILSRVKIRKGAIVEAKSVVSKDVPPCGIVLGNPAKIIRFRIPENLIETFKNINMPKLNNKFTNNNINLLYKKLDTETLKSITDKLTKE